MLVLQLSSHQLLVSIAFLLGLVSAWLTSLFCRALRRRHQQTWLALGEPNAFYNFSLRTQFMVNKFIWLGEHRVLSDRKLDRLADAIKALTVIVILVLVAAGAVWSGEE